MSGARQRLGRAGPVQLRPPEGLVGVDVADAADHGLVEQRALEAGVPPADGGDERLVVERPGPPGRGRCARASRAARHRPARRRPPGRRTCAGRRSGAGARRRPRRRSGSGPGGAARPGRPARPAELTAHPEVTDEGIAGVQREPQVLPAPGGGVEAAPASSAAKSSAPGSWRRTAGGAGPRPRPAAADHAAFETAADGLDLGEFRQAGSGLGAERRVDARGSADPSAVARRVPRWGRRRWGTPSGRPRCCVRLRPGVVALLRSGVAAAGDDADRHEARAATPGHGQLAEPAGRAGHVGCGTEIRGTDQG